MNSLNKVQLIGNMTADPEIRETPNGTKVATFSVATNKTWKDDNGIKQESVQFHTIVAWRGLAEIVENYTEKGKKLYIEWELNTRSWEDDNGIKRYKTEVVAANIILLSSWGSRDENEEKPKKKKESSIEEDFPEKKKATKKRPPVEEEITIEDIPF